MPAPRRSLWQPERLTEPASFAYALDLVAVGYEPTLIAFDQRPYLYGSNESVTVTLDKPGKIYAMVHAYGQSPVAANHFGISIE